MDNLEIVAIINRDDNIKEVRFVLNHEDVINFRGTAMVDVAKEDLVMNNLKDHIIGLLKKEMEL
ncbi:hypothetical protein G7084_03820 [Weissella coleopterorum]|uniref:Uncharacterized protein n=1 Tax=Weissella coleopterorum TaxID=2714949 RepID=A0A6G8AZV3_9LACO|nr:hypothetical protein [Weissella coleopterorum]QIL50517.1 hypothetical protein G7084_03820 [Weissella coleopterorum]